MSNMNHIFDSQEHIAGVLLLASIVPFAAFAVLELTGSSPGNYGLFRPIEELADRLPVSSWGLVWQIAYLVMVLAGFCVMAARLIGAGDAALPLYPLSCRGKCADLTCAIEPIPHNAAKTVLLKNNSSSANHQKQR